MKSLTGVAAAAMLAAFAAGKAAGRTYLVSGELCYADGARLYASDGSLSFQPASPAGMYLFETNAALPSYTAHPPAGRAVERWALVSLTDAAMHGSYEAASPLLEAFPGDGRVSDDGLVYSPKWKQFSADAGSFIHAAPCFKWLEYDIAFDPNTQSGGSGVDAALAMEGVAYTNTVVLPGRPSTSRWSPQYHTLLGLSTNAAATTADFEFGGRVERAGELFGATNGATIVLYGVWRADPIPVALDRGDGAVAGDTNIYAVCGQAMPPAVMPSRPGGQFKGYWHEEAVGGPVQYYGPQGESVRDWDMEYAATLKARWSPVAASVSFEDGDGAEGGPGSIEVLYGALPPDIKVPVRKGWIFDGYWSFSVGGTRYYDESGKPTTEAWTRITPLKLYARWKPVEYTIVYIWDGGTPGGYVQNSAVSGMPFPVSVPVRDGYVFAGFELSGEYDPTVAGYGDSPDTAAVQSVKDGFCPAQPGQRFMYFVNLASEATTVTLRARWEKTGDAASVATAMPKSLPCRAAASAGGGESGDAGVPPSAADLEQAADCAGTLQLVPWMIEGTTQQQTNGCWMVRSDDGAINGSAVYCSITITNNPQDVGCGVARLSTTVEGKGELKFRWKATVAMSDDLPEWDRSIPGTFVIVTNKSLTKIALMDPLHPEKQRPGTDWEEVVISIDTQNLDVVWFVNGYSEKYRLWIDDIRWVPRSIVAEAESVDRPYDGNEHSALVKVAYPTNGCKVSYALAKSGPYSGENPVFTNAISTTVWYVVSAEGFPSYTNSVDVKITQATNEWKVVPDVEDRTVGDTNGVNFGEARFGDVAAEFWSGDGKIKYSDIANVSTGLCMAIFTVVETANWTGLSHTNIFEATPGDKRNITVVATPYSGEYDGAGHTIAISDVKAADGLPLAETNIAYSLSQDGPFDLEVAPPFTNVCETSVWYRVSAEGCIPFTGSAEVKIAQATNSWTVEPSFTGNWLQDGTNSLRGVAKFGTVTVEYFDSVGMTVSPDAITGAGSYMACFTVAETENWTGLTKEVSFNVYGVGASATGYAGAYDGSGHGIAVSVSKPESGWTIGYALSPDAEYKAECPLFTNVCETSVWYRVFAAGYVSLTGSASVKITQAENSWTVEPSFSGNWQQDGTNCLKGAAKFGMATIEYFNSVNMPVSPDAITGAGSYTARFTVAETENWTGLTKEVSFNVYGVGASATGYAGAYDGSGHGIAVSVSNPESGWTIGYALSPDAEYKAECPLFTNVCETSVWYRVSAAGYVSLTGCASVKIACATNTWKVAPSMASWRDTEDASEPESASAFGEVIVAYKTANGRVLPSRPSVRGDYVAVFTVEGSENWTSVSTEVPFTIYESEPVVCVMATSCMGEYDGSSHSIEVSVDPGATNRCSARYSLTKDGPFADAAPVYVQAMTNGPVKVWYEVLADGYAGVTNFATVEIFKATNAWLVVPNMAGRTAGVEYEPPAAVPQFGNVSVVYDGAATNAPRNAGIHTARFTVPETRNWCGLVTNISYRIAGDGSSGEEDDGGDSDDSGGDDSGGGDDGGGEGEGGGSGGGDGEESDAYAIAFTNDATYAKAQTIAGALYNADGSLAGVVQLKFGKKNARKSTVRVSGSATLLDGRKASARGVTLKFSEDGAVSGTLTFKEPVGEMVLAAGADGIGLLAGASYFMKAAKVGGPLAGGAASGVFRLSDDFDLAAAGTLQTDLLPFEEPFSVVRRKWKFPGNASVKLQTDKATGLKSLTVSYGRNGDKTNKSSIKLSYTEKTGRFTGSFKAYSVSENARGSKKLVKYTVKIVGFVLDGSGVGAATVKKPAGGPWAVSVE